jgi:hypothetical protein
MEPFFEEVVRVLGERLHGLRVSNDYAKKNLDSLEATVTRLIREKDALLVEMSVLKGANDAQRERIEKQGKEIDALNALRAAAKKRRR